ncbi:MAG TPA: DUF1778 domain-containing protein [Acidobacteriaceae bacterium]|jgi:uncharacterized protein (DUF1778 family)
MAETALRTERTEARLRPEQKKRIDRAASIKGLSRSDFIVQTADEAAIRIIQEHETWSLALPDRERFIKALLNPPKPSSRLRAAAKRYKKRIARS